jgi:HD-GYP domain-containing protein (c-di-GMP phosphodiesterase class II)
MRRIRGLRLIVPFLLLSEARAPVRHGRRRERAEASESRAVLLRALADRDPELHEHTVDVAVLARRVAARLGCDGRTRAAISLAAELHDVGKVAIPDLILRKPGPLDADETELMRMHAEIGAAIVLESPGLAAAAALVRASHERWDGAGYPDGLAGEEIPLGARVVAVCDAYSAMRQERPYGPVLSDAEARAELVRCAGTQFDPRVVAVFCTR